MPTDLFEKAKIMLVRDEGLRLKPYRCPAGKLTIGVGHNIDDKGITQKTAFQILADDLTEVQEALYRIFAKDWFDKLSDERKLALMNLVFNLGEAGFADFATTISLMKAGEWSKAADRLLQTKYAAQVGDRAHRVASMLRDNEFPYA